MNDTLYTSYIDGAWLSPDGAVISEDRSPITGEVVGRIAHATASQAEVAIAAAATAFPAWRDAGAMARGRYLLAAADLLKERREAIARTFSLEEGKPIVEARGEVQRTIDLLVYYGSEGARFAGETLPSSRPGVFLYTMREPLGVVSLITPWNFPIAIPAWKLAPALICGNTVVIKPSEKAPITGIALIQALADAGLPRGVVNLLLGDPNELGPVMIGNEQVRAVSFTGSTAVGRKVQQMAAARGIRVQCEMGGKNPLIVAADADLDIAVRIAIDGAFSGTGQKCTATSRIIVEQPVIEAFTEKLVAATRKLTIGDPRQESNYIGPLVDDGALQKVLDYIRIGQEEGARLLTGGQRCSTPPLNAGCFVEPTLFAGVTPSMRIAREEIFGPVAAILAAGDFEEAMALANDTEYGLCASIATTSLARAATFVRNAQVGLAMVNLPSAGVEFQAPFGGTRNSGSGFKEQGQAAIEFYSDTRTVAMHHGTI